MTVQPSVSANHPPPVVATPPCRPADTASEAESGELPLNYGELVRRCMGRIELAERLLASFCQRFPSELAQGEACFIAGDGERLTRLAHQLKGAAANVSAGYLQAATGRLEESARAGRREEIAAQLAEIRLAWEDFQAFRESLSSTAKTTNYRS